MTIDQRPAALRAMRAYLDLPQSVVMAETGLSQSTLTAAEKGQALSDKTWRRLTELYGERGVQWREGTLTAKRFAIDPQATEIVEMR